MSATVVESWPTILTTICVHIATGRVTLRILSLAQKQEAVNGNDDEGVELPLLETFHYDHRKFEVVPGEEERAIDPIEDWPSGVTYSCSECSN